MSQTITPVPKDPSDYFTDWSIQILPHQLDDIKCMMDRENAHTAKVSGVCTIYTYFSIYGVNMRIGRMIVILGLIGLMKNDSPPSEGVQVLGKTIGPFVCLETRRPVTNYNTTIILANGSIQWKEVLQRTDLNYLVIENTRKLFKIDLPSYDVLVVNASTLKKIIEVHPRVQWRRFIYDECVSYVIPSLPIVRANFTWFVTATWDALRKFTRDKCDSAKPSHYMRKVLHGLDIDDFVYMSNQSRPTFARNRIYHTIM